MGRKAEPEVVYHFTSPHNLVAILKLGYLAVSGSNLNIAKGNVDVVWLTTSPMPQNHGLGETENMVFNKKIIRITVKHKPSFKLWDEWSDKKGINKEWKDTLIFTANAEETHKTWYISEHIIPFDDIIKIENVVTGAEIPLPKIPITNPSKVKVITTTDEYIAVQSPMRQVLLLNVREAIRSALPNATEKISYNMPTFYLQGCYMLAFGAAKNHLGIYPGAAAMKYFAPRLMDYKTSKGTIQLPYEAFGSKQIALISEIATWCRNKRLEA